MIITAIILLLLIISIFIFVRQPKFGKLSSGERLNKIKNSPNFKNGQFQNLNHTPMLTEGASYPAMFKDFIFGKSKNSKPPDTLPSKKTDLLNLNPADNILVWFGHSSYFMQLDGKKILVDPVLSGSASPIKFTTRSFKGSEIYTTDDIPAIDYLFITHDHWDHLDYETVLKLKHKIKKVITGLGSGAHLEHWKYDADKIIELDWNEELKLENGFIVNTTSTRHFSGRGLKRNASLWISFILTTPSMKIYIGGDSGFDNHFIDIGSKFGPFDLAILENGQYNKSWKYIHMMPEEVVQAAIDLRAKKLMTVHWSKFSLALHDWDDPILRVCEECKKKNVELIHPMIGEEVNLKEPGVQTHWWDIGKLASKRN